MQFTCQYVVELFCPPFNTRRYRLWSDESKGPAKRTTQFCFFKEQKIRRELAERRANKHNMGGFAQPVEGAQHAYEAESKALGS